MCRLILVLCAVMVIAGCSTITINPRSEIVVRDEPSYEQTRDFFLWGLVGEERVNVTEACDGKAVAQMQSQATFVNGFLGLITLGIYSPHTVKVWCEDAILNRGEA
ncbi:MAG: Bor family protein [Gammaproteobacteria bacterium]|nr:Bor family protein [Gammaproteobacteria bacterium]